MCFSHCDPLPGDAPPIEADEKFSTNYESLVEMLTRQLSVYEREEHALRVLMEEEVKEKMHSHQTKGNARNHFMICILETSFILKICSLNSENFLSYGNLIFSLLSFLLFLPPSTPSHSLDPT